jgi:hypothetical protein
MLKILLRLLREFGVLGLLGGALAFGLVLAFLSYFTSFLPDVARDVAAGFGVAGVIIGFYFDNKYEFTAKMFRKKWLDEQKAAIELLRIESLDYRQALEKYYNASYEISQVPSFFRRLLPVLSKNINKEIHQDKLWVIRHVLPMLPPDFLPGNRNNLMAWLPVVDELAVCLSVVRTSHSLFQQWFTDGFNVARTAHEVVELWQSRYQTRTTLGGEADVGAPKELSGATSIPINTYIPASQERESEKQ